MKRVSRDLGELFARVLISHLWAQLSNLGLISPDDLILPRTSHYLELPLRLYPTFFHLITSPA